MGYRQTILVMAACGLLLTACSETGDDDAGIGGGTTGQGSGPVTDGGTTDGGDAEGQIDTAATSFFFSYDESASTASRDLSLFAIAVGLRPAASLGRPYEFLNAESFEPFDAQEAGVFDVSMTLRRAERGEVPLAAEPEGRLYALGVNVEGPALTREERRNVVLTLLVDVSGSMESPYAQETRSDVRSLLDVVKYGLERLPSSLKPGDVVNLVTFASSADLIVEGLDGTDGTFTDVVATLTAGASTNIGRGIDLAYQVANRTFDPDKANRVIMLTDAFVNQGELDARRIADEAVRGELEGIRFSGIGIGSGFNDEVLNTVSDAGRGTYSAMITPNDAERLFTRGFARFIDPAASDVRFELAFPDELDQLRSFGEEISVDPDDVQTVNFSYNADQFFLELFQGPDGIDVSQAISLSIDYTGPDGERRNVSATRSIDALLANTTAEIDAAFAVSTLAELIGERLDCGTVQSSDLYQRPVQNATYALYRQNIERYCAQNAPYDYFYY